MRGIGRRLYAANVGRLNLATDEDIRELFRQAAADVDGHRFGAHFLRTEWSTVVDAWQLASWENYRDVQRLGRKTRLAESSGRCSGRSPLGVESLSHDCTIGAETLADLHRPAHIDGQRASALRFGDPRVQALLAALDGAVTRRFRSNRPGERRETAQTAPQVTEPSKKSQKYGRNPAQKAPRRAHADQLPQQPPEVAAGDLHEQPLENVRMPSKIHPAHPAGLAHAREGSLQQFSPTAR